MFTGDELLAAGIDKSAITRRLRAKTLHRMYRNVYSIAPPALLRPEARWLGAVLACGDGAVLSHCSAAVLWGLLEDRWSFVDVTTLRRGRKGTEGIRLHRTRRLEPADVVVVRELGEVLVGEVGGAVQPVRGQQAEDLGVLALTPGVDPG